MKKILLLIVAMLFSAAALAQYKWVDKDGKVRYGDTPPAGVKATPMNAPSGGYAPPPPAADKSAAKDGKSAKAAPKGPLTPAEQDADFRKRQIEADKSREKDQKVAQEAQGKKQNCTAAQDQLRLYDSGQRIARTNPSGERYYLEEGQIAQESAKARQAVQQWCN
jgi:hypothetical protein